MSNLVKASGIDGERKSLALGFLLGLIPGLGLFYAAPFLSAAIATIFAGAVLTIVGWLAPIPILGWLIGKLAFFALSLTSGVLGLLYANTFNDQGQRTTLAAKSGDKSLPL